MPPVATAATPVAVLSIPYKRYEDSLSKSVLQNSHSQLSKAVLSAMCCGASSGTLSQNFLRKQHGLFLKLTGKFEVAIASPSKHRKVSKGMFWPSLNGGVVDYIFLTGVIAKIFTIDKETMCN